MATAVQNNVISSNDEILTTSADNDLGFEYFSCEIDGSTSFTCSHFQMRPADTYTGGFRFEKDHLAKAYFFDKAPTAGNPNWRTAYITLERAATTTLSAVALASMLLFAQ